MPREKDGTISEGIASCVVPELFCYRKCTCSRLMSTRQLIMTENSTSAPSTDVGQPRPPAGLFSSSSNASMTEIGVDERIHIQQGLIQELNDRLDLLERDIPRIRRLLVPLSHRVRDQALMQADHDQHLRNFVIALQRTAEIFLRATEHTHGF